MSCPETVVGRPDSNQSSPLSQICSPSSDPQSGGRTTRPAWRTTHDAVGLFDDAVGLGDDVAGLADDAVSLADHTAGLSDNAAAKGGGDVALGLGNHRGRKGLQDPRQLRWPHQLGVVQAVGRSRDRQFAAGRDPDVAEFSSSWDANARTIHFNLDGVSPAAYKAFAKNPSFGYGNITNWELHQLLTTGVGGKARFYGKGGAEVGIDAVRAMFQ